MKSFEEFAKRVDDLLAQLAGPAAGMEMLVRAKDEGAFSDYRNDKGRWTEEQARAVAERIVRETGQDPELARTALARLSIP